MERLRVSSLQWAMGGFYALIGILLLVVPHRMSVLPGYILSTRPTEAGFAALIAGLLLLVCAQFALPARMAVLIHLANGLALVGLGLHSLQVGTGENPTAAVLLGATLLLAALSPLHRRSTNASPSNDLLSLAAGVLALGAALTLLFELNQEHVPFGLSATEAWLYATGFVLSSLWLIGLQVYAWQKKTSPLELKALAWAGYTLAGLVLISFAFVVLIPQEHWLNAALYGVTGLVLVLIPWSPLYSETLAPASLRLRLAFILSAALAIPLLLTTAMLGRNLEQSRKAEALVRQELQASAVASRLADYVSHHQAAVAALAAQADLLAASPEETQARMAVYAAAYPDVTAFSLFDPQGQLLVTTAGSAPAIPVTAPEELSLSGSFSPVSLSNGSGSPVLEVTAPILNPANEIGGLVTAGLPTVELAALVETAGAEFDGAAFLVDAGGRLIAHSNPESLDGQTNMRPHPAIARGLSAGSTVGSLSFQRESTEWLSAYAEIPGLGWELVVERPAENVVATVHKARDLGFGLLVTFIMTGLIAGLVLGGWLTRPFQTVAAALGAVQSGHQKISLSPLSFQEGYSLVAEFDALRQRLANREQALDTLRTTRRYLEHNLTERSADLKVVTDQLMHAKELLVRSAKDQEWLETALWESERRFRSVGELMPFGVWVSDSKGSTIFVSQQYLDLLNVTIEEVLPYGGIRQAHPDDVSPAVKSWQNAIRNGMPWELQHELQDANGEIRVILSRGRPVRDEKGAIASWVGVHLDVTDLRLMEDRFGEQKKRFRVALSNSATMMYANDTSLRYTWVYNPLHGYTTEEMVGRCDEDIVPNADLTELIEFKKLVIQKREPLRKDVHLRIGDRTLTYDVSAEPHMDRNGEVDGLIVATVDITDRQRMAEEIEHNTLLIELQHRLNDQHEIERIKFSRDLHDGPLQDLIAITFQLQQVIFQAKEPALLEQMQQVQATLQDEVRNLRTFCYALRPPLLSRFGLAKAIESFAESFQPRHPDLTLTLDLMEDGQHLPERVRAALFRIFQEGIGNIVRHSHATEASVRLFFEGGRAILEVEDNGVGFAPPADWLTYARNGQLGLAGIRERVEGLGGSMELKSSPGTGARLCVQIPWQREPSNVPF